MKVSQLLHTMDRDDVIVIDNGNKYSRLNKMRVFEGTIRDIKRDSPINKMIVKYIFANKNVIYVMAEEPRKKGTKDDR